MELVFVALVLVVLVTAVLPSFRRTWMGVEAERTAFDVVQLLRAGRVLAVNQAESVDWVWDETGHVYCVRKAGDTCAAEPITSDRLGRIHTVPTDVVLTAIRDGTATDRIRFFPNGTAQDATVTVGDQTRTRQEITVRGVTGYIDIKPAGASATPPS